MRFATLLAVMASGWTAGIAAQETYPVQSPPPASASARHPQALDASFAQLDAAPRPPSARSAWRRVRGHYELRAIDAEATLVAMTSQATGGVTYGIVAGTPRACGQTAPVAGTSEYIFAATTLSMATQCLDGVAVDAPDTAAGEDRLARVLEAGTAVDATLANRQAARFDLRGVSYLKALLAVSAVQSDR
ncbi:hypothetical protein KPL74_19825 [Bacillus sp. NP157]|nr:hypothetical protein KPL74_19825 [Bacillus sp. NP157]